MKPAQWLAIAVALSLIAVGSVAAQPGGASDEVGPPGGLPDVVPDFVGNILDSIGDFLRGAMDGLGDVVSGLTPGGDGNAAPER